MGSSYNRLIRTDSNVFFLMANIPWCIHHVPQLSYPFVCWWASRLLPCPGYCKQCCDEHWGARVSFRSGFLAVYAQEWDCWVIWKFCFQFFKESPHCSPQRLYQFAFPPILFFIVLYQFMYQPTVREGSLFSTSSTTLYLFSFWW